MRKLKLFSITSSIKNLDETLQIFVELPCVYPVKSNEFVSLVHGLTSLDRDDRYLVISKTIEDIEKVCSLEIEALAYDRSIEYVGLENAHTYLNSLYKELSHLQERITEKKKQVKTLLDAKDQMLHIMDLDVSLDRLFSCKYVKIRFGKLPKDSLDILKMYQKKHIFFELLEEKKEFYWCMYMTPLQQKNEIDNIFSSLYFERIYITDYVHEKPEEAIASLDEHIRTMTKSSKRLEKELNQSIQNSVEELAKLKGYMNHVEKISSAKQYVVGLGEKFNIKGFVEKNRASDITDAFKEMKGLEVDILPAHFDKRLKAPKRSEMKCKNRN